MQIDISMVGKVQTTLAAGFLATWSSHVKSHLQHPVFITVKGLSLCMFMLYVFYIDMMRDDLCLLQYISEGNERKTSITQSFTPL